MKFSSSISKFVLPCALLVLFSVGLTGLLSGCGPKQGPVAGESGSKTLYTCGMHPQVVQDKPGNCPICGMKLTPIRKQDAGAQGSATPASGERKVKYYRSTMMPGETSPAPGKDSMGMEMVPVYEDQAAA